MQLTHNSGLSLVGSVWVTCYTIVSTDMTFIESDDGKVGICKAGAVLEQRSIRCKPSNIRHRVPTCSAGKCCTYALDKRVAFWNPINSGWNWKYNKQIIKLPHNNVNCLMRRNCYIAGLFSTPMSALIG